MKYEGISFNQSWIASFDSEKKFVDVMSEEGYLHILENDKNRKAKLKEIYRLATENKAMAKKIEAIDADKNIVSKGDSKNVSEEG